MKKIVSFVLTAGMCLSMGVALSGCNQTPPPASNYTVTESEWRTNLNLTKTAQATACSAMLDGSADAMLCSTLTGITSYTVHGVGVSGGTSGEGFLKVAPNALSTEFYVEGQLKAGETGTFASDTDFYQGLTNTLMRYFPFADYYDDFTFDQSKNAYVCENLVSEQNDVYDVDDIFYIYTKEAEVTFIDGYLNTITVTLSDETFENIFAEFVFTFTDINNTVVTL